MIGDARDLLEKLDARQQKLAAQVIAIERKHNFQAKSGALDQDITAEIIDAVRREVTDDKEAGS